MEAFVKKWAARDDPQDNNSDSDDSSSSDGSIPNVRPLNPFTSYNSSVDQGTRSRPAPPGSSGDDHSSDSEVEDILVVRSDIPPPQPQQLGEEVAGTLPALAPAPAPAPSRPSLTGKSSGSTSTKRNFSAQHRERIRQSVKERWASGKMSHVGKKARETRKRHLGLLDSADEEERLPKKATSAQIVPVAKPPRPGAAEWPRQALDLWEYIRPHLPVHKDGPIPTKCWVPNLLVLPRSRDIEFNPRRSGKRAYIDKDDREIASLLLYLTGINSTRACWRCLSGSGPFKGCVKLPPGTAGINMKHCANCHYSRQACGDNTAVDDGSVVVMEDEWQEVDREREDIHDATTLLQEASEQGTSRLPPLLHTMTGRLYSEWPDEFGKLTVMKGGVTLPDGYTVNHGAERPWNCPIDECNRSFVSVTSLGYHFSRKHYACMLNDNCDGTLSVVGLYDNPTLGIGGSFPKEPPSFPYVVSQNPRDSDDPRPNMVHTAMAMSKSQRMPQVDTLMDVDDDSLRPLDDESSKSMWAYIRPHLKKTKEIPDTGWVKELLPLPQVRDLEWNPNRRHDFYETVPRDISCLIVQVTGEEAPDPCTKCLEGKNPFDGCVVISRDAPAEVRARMVSCANCNYHGRQSECSIKNWVVSRPQPPFPGYLGKGGNYTSSISRPTSSGPSRTPDKPFNDSGRRLSERYTATASATSAQAGSSGPAGNRNVTEVRRSAPRVQSPQMEQSAVISYGQIQQDRPLEVEDWEIAPGRIRSEASETPDNIALSGAYLTSNKSIQISDDLAVRVDVINWGNTLRFEAEKDKIRSCFVASGKLKIKIDGEPEFTIGPHGHFKIRPGVACSAQNRLYTSAVLHVHMLTEYN